MKEQSGLAGSDAERWGRVGMGGTTRHTATRTPIAAERFDDASSVIRHGSHCFELLIPARIAASAPGDRIFLQRTVRLMFSLSEVEIDMISRRIIGFLAVSLAGSVPAAAFANAVSRDPDRPEVVRPSENAAAATDFALFEHREIRVAATETAHPVARSASRKARLAPNQARHLKLRPLIKPLVTAAELRHALPYGLLDALIVVESGYRPLAISRAGAAGLAQLMPATARNLGVANRFDIASSIDGGARYLRAQLDRFESVALALAAYNAGPGAVSRARGIPQNGETPDYVSKVLAAWSTMAGAPA